MPIAPDATPAGLNIRAEMGRQRMTMSELSTRTNIPRTTLTHQIDGRGLTVDNLMRIATALGVTIADLLPDDANELDDSEPARASA